MAPPQDEPPAPEPTPPVTLERHERHRTFAEGLSKEERVLVLIRDELYAGSWDDLEADLLLRRDRKPSIFKLTTRIDEDLSRIHRLRAFERTEGVDLRPLVDRAGGANGAEGERAP